MRNWHTPSPAIRAKPECREDVLVALRTFRVRYALHGDHPENLFQSRRAGAQFFHGIFLHRAHSVRSRSITNLLHAPVRPDNRAYGIIEPKQFVYSNSTFVACLVAFFATNRHSHGHGRPESPCLHHASLEFRSRSLDGMARAQLSYQTLRQNSRHG